MLVSGESGIGKTALVTEAVREAAGAGATTAWGTCWDADRAPGYWPWAQVVRQMVNRSEAEFLDSMSDEDRADLARLVPDLGGGAPVSVEEPDSPRAQFRLFDAVARLLERSARPAGGRCLRRSPMGRRLVAGPSRSCSTRSSTARMPKAHGSFRIASRRS